MERHKDITNVLYQTRKNGKAEKRIKFKLYMKKYGSLYIMLIPVLAYFIIFKYAPMYGASIAFKDFKLKLGILGSEWVGFKNFELFWGTRNFNELLSNTLLISILKLLWGFPAPIILALMLNEVRSLKYKKTIQTISYLPHFLSWVIVAQLVHLVFDSSGIINSLRNSLSGESPVLYMLDRGFFVPMLIGVNMWKDVGWGTLLYLAALTAIDPQLYEAAVIDGASRLKQTIHITLPGLMATTIILLILRMSGMLNAGFEDILMLKNSQVSDLVNVLDVHVYEQGVINAKYSYASAIGLFKSVVSLILVLGTNWIARRCGEVSLL